MSKKLEKKAVFELLRQKKQALSLPEILAELDFDIAERTLRSWLVSWVDENKLLRTGQKRGTRYQWVATVDTPIHFAFLDAIPSHRRVAVLAQIRDVWTHTSTALEGNTLSLGDTHFILQEGLTISGKPIREHQEVIGHARAIELVYAAVRHSITRELLFDLHRAVQTDQVVDIYKPYGAWKVEPNGTNVISPDGQQVFMEYALPCYVDGLMAELIAFINKMDIRDITIKTAPEIYAKVHMAIAHVHPFWDGNGRIARLLANVLLLKAGLPPLLIDQALRREYIVSLSHYQLAVGSLTDKTGLWPDMDKLAPFTAFCERAYTNVQDIIEQAMMK